MRTHDLDLYDKYKFGELTIKANADDPDGPKKIDKWMRIVAKEFLACDSSVDMSELDAYMSQPASENFAWWTTGMVTSRGSAYP